MATHWSICDSSAWGGDKEDCGVGGDDSNMYKNVDVETELMALQVENDLHEDLELQSELWHALDVLIVEHEDVEMPSQSNVKSNVAYVEYIRGRGV